MNKVCLIGNLTRDPELRHTAGGTAVCQFSIAVNDRKPDGNGGYEDYAHYFDVTVWAKQGENCAQFLAKGKKVGVTGKLEQQRWQDKDSGANRSKVVIVAEPFGVDFLTPRDGNGSSSNQFVPSGAGASDGGGWGDFPAVADDDIPF